MVFTIPIYWTQQFKTKPDKTVLNGLNFYRNAHYHTLNTMKRDVEELLLNQFRGVGPIIGPYRVSYSLYYKTSTCDGSNVVAIIEKCFLDALQQSGLVREDNVLHHLGSSWTIAGKDIINPRCEVIIQEA